MQCEVEGINKLRNGSLIIAISAFIGLLSLIIMAASLVASLNTLSTSITSVLSILGTLAAILILIIIAAIINIVGLIYVKDGFEILKSLGRDVGIGYTGTILALISLIIEIIGLLSVFIGDVFIVLVAGVLATIGDILVGAGFYKVGEIYNEDTTKIAGILEVIGGIGNIIIIPSLVLIFMIIFLIAFILLYIGLGKIYLIKTPMPPTQPTYPMNNMNPVTTSASPVQPSYSQLPQTQPSPQIYQVGQGIIRGNGFAQVSLYSTTHATILSARIDGTTLSSVNVNPVVLQPGKNDLTIWFSNTNSLIPNANYFITLVIDIGGNISGIRAAAVYQP